MKGLFLEFLFLSLLWDMMLFGAVWPWIKSRIRKESQNSHDIEHARSTRGHVITFWNDHGTGRGDDANGWRCSCGLFRIGNWGIDEHLEFIKEIEEANKKIEVITNE
jgi:hypothetical protein